MNKPIRQHFIPRSYLNNFAEKKNDKYFIFGENIKSEVIQTLSTKDVCVSKNLYTIPTSDVNRKYEIENFYADNVDKVFPEVYNILKDKSIKKIDLNTRLKIIKTCLSLYFRTPKFLNLQNEIFEEIKNKYLSNSDKNTISVSIFGKDTIISKEEFEFIINKKKRNK